MPTGDVELSLWIVTAYRGDAAAARWPAPEMGRPRSFAAEDILEADRPFVEALAHLARPEGRRARGRRSPAGVYNCGSQLPFTMEHPMAAQNDLPEVQLDPTSLYREDVFTDRRAGSIRRLTPVTVDGAPMRRATCCIPARRSC